LVAVTNFVGESATVVTRCDETTQRVRNKALKEQNVSDVALFLMFPQFDCPKKGR